MRLLILTARFPEYGYKGDQLRARQLLELLAPAHELQLVSGGAPSSREALREVQGLAHVTLVRAGALARTLGAMELLARGQPAEIGWMAPRRLRQRARTAAASCNAAIAVTVRVVTEPLPTPLIIDHIDALSANLRERARFERYPLTRLAASTEALLLSRHERRAASWAAAQIAVSATDAMALAQRPPPVVVPQAVFETISADELSASHGSAARDIDLILTGNMQYPPNRDAAQWLADQILPELRRLRGQTRVVVAGRHANRLSLEGIEVASDVADLYSLLRRARVAIVPLRGGTGVPNKLLEAAAAGAAIAATPAAAASAGVAALSADSASTLAAAVARLLADDELRFTMASRALRDLSNRSPARVGGQLQDVLMQIACDTHAPASSRVPGS